MKVSRRLNAIVKSCKHWPGAVPMPHLIPRGARILTLDICGSGKWQGHPLGRSVVVESVDWILSVGKKPVFRWCWTSKISSIGRSSRAPLIFLGLKKSPRFVASSRHKWVITMVTKQFLWLSHDKSILSPQFRFWNPDLSPCCLNHLN
jgi:hypothetical protein